MDRGSADAIPRLRTASRYGRAGHRLIRINDRLRICFVWTGSDGEQVEITYITRTYYSSPARAKRATEDAMLFAIISLGCRKLAPFACSLIFRFAKREGEKCDGGPRHLSFRLFFR